MNFSKKLFILIFGSSFVAGAGILWLAHGVVEGITENEFQERYSKATSILAESIRRMDTRTEDVMKNAALVLKERTRTKGVISNEKLSSFKNELGVTHIFMTDASGKFIRSTNEDPKLIPNLFSFCSKYRELVDGNLDREATPIIVPRPEPQPHKFLSVPTYDRKHIIEVGIRVDFINRILREAVESNEDLVSMSVYDPVGNKLGSSEGLSEMNAKTVTHLPEDGTVQKTKESLTFYKNVSSSHLQCCQCNKSGTSKNGEYYYVVEAKVSRAELISILSIIKWLFIGFGFFVFVLSFAFARFISRNIVRNLELAADRVKKIKEKPNLGQRIDITGKDEVAYLTKEFDALLDEIEESQEKVLRAEVAESKVVLAKEIAHNLKSPIAAMGIRLKQATGLTEKQRRTFDKGLKEMKALVAKLHKRADELFDDDSSENKPELTFLSHVIDEQVEMKQTEYSENEGVEISYQRFGEIKDAYSVVNAFELKSILSNLINNAIESYGAKGGKVDVSLKVEDYQCNISVCDSGAGIPKEYLEKLGKERISFKGTQSRGIGLTHAFKTIESWGGRIELQSELGKGTQAVIRLKRYIQKIDERPHEAHA